MALKPYQPYAIYFKSPRFDCKLQIQRGLFLNILSYNYLKLSILNSLIF